MVRALMTAADGSDVVVRSPAWPVEERPGGVLGVGDEPLALPFGVVELVVVTGRGAGAVHRLDVGRYRCGADRDSDLVLPTDVSWVIDVRCGGEVFVCTLDEEWRWPVGERRRLGGLDLALRWCGGPSGLTREPASLADLLLGRIAGVSAAPGEARWSLGREAGSGDEVTVTVSEAPVLLVRGTERHAYARAVLGRLLTGTADPLRLTVLAPGLDVDERARWAWTRWLPQARCDDERFVRAGFDDDACARLVSEIAGEERGESVDLVVVDGHVGEVGALARPGLAMLVLDDEVPETGTVVDVDGPRARVAGLPGDLDGRTLDVDLPDTAWIERLARAMTAVSDDPPPPGGRLLGLLGMAPTDAGAIFERWQSPTTTRVVIGEDPAEGVPVALDLRADGPHALVGGTTGSGKSELLQTLVASLAVSNAPEAMTFLLVDYKGGAAFAACHRLPHTLGVVTDLDVALTERALASLSAEVRRRERLLAEAGVADLDAYLAAGRGPLARLVIVVDEFATLAAELPDFVDGLVDIARRGRSLGLHLVLATQRPAGAVSADIRANTTLRIALRVADTADSVDVVGVPDAAAIDERRPGRAIVRVGRNHPVEVQTARVTTCDPTVGSASTPYVFGEPVDMVGESDLALLAATMRGLVAEKGLVVPPSPWLPPLPARVELADCAMTGVVPFGIEDLPGRQRREVAHLRLDEGAPLTVVGGAGSGRTGVLRALVASVALRFEPSEVHVHAIDAGARGLAGIARLPHIGVVAGRDEPDRAERLVARLTDQLDDRVQRLARHGWRDAADQREAEPDTPWPWVVVLVDRWDLLAEAADAVDDRAAVAALERIATEGARAGILVVATGDRSMLTGRVTSLFPDRLLLRLADPYDYAAVGLPGPAGHGEPGRGWRGLGAIETQVADVDEVLEELLERGDACAPVEGGPFRIDPLPGFVTREEVAALPEHESRPAGALLVAAGGDELGARWIDADEYGPCALVTGRRRTGRSGALLTLAESALVAGWEVAVVAGRRSPLEALPSVGGTRVHGVFRRDEDADRLLAVVDRCVSDSTRLLVVADDVDLVPDGPLLDALAALPARLRDTGSLFVGSGEAEEIVGAFRGPAPALRRARCGVMLSPQTLEDGEAFGVRLRRAQYGRALGVGAGFLVLDGLPERVQVACSSYIPEP